MKRFRSQTCVRRFELPTPWSVAKCSIQLSYTHTLLASSNMDILLPRIENVNTFFEKSNKKFISCATKKFHFIQRLAVSGFVSLPAPFFRLIRKAVCSTMATSNVCRFIILSISVQTKKGMSEDSTHRKPLLCLVTSFIRAAGDR